MGSDMKSGMGLDKVVCEYDVPDDKQVNMEWSRINKILSPLAGAAKEVSEVPYDVPFYSIGVNYENNPRRIVIESIVLSREQIEAAIQGIDLE